MATVKVLTYDRMIEIEAQAVVGADVVDGNLVMERHNGSTFIAGPVSGSSGSPENKTVDIINPSGPAASIYNDAYSVFDVTMDEDCEISFFGAAPAGTESRFTLVLRGAFTPTWPDSVAWTSGSEPTHVSPAVYIFMSVDGGTVWFGFQAGSGMVV